MLNTLFNCWKAVHYRWFLAIGHLPNLCRIFVVGILYFTIPNTPLPSSRGEIINFTEIGENAICIIDLGDGRGDLTKWYRTKWHGQNGTDKMVYGQNGMGQNGMDKMVWIRWYGQNGSNFSYRL